MLFYFIAYVIVTWIGILHTIFNIKVLKMKSMKESPGMGEGYERTKPWHPLYNIIIFPICSYYHLRVFEKNLLENAIQTSLIWGSVTIVIDLIGWV